MIPMIAMQFTDQVQWNVMDFLVAGIMLLATGLTVILIRKKVKKRYQIILIISVFLLLLLGWAELGVGVFGSSFSGD